VTAHDDEQRWKSRPQAAYGIIGFMTVAAKAKVEVLAIVRAMYGSKRSEKELLAFDPNDVDALDPSILYEIIEERFGVNNRTTTSRASAAAWLT
jgi:hypothetical protein